MKTNGILLWETAVFLAAETRKMVKGQKLDKPTNTNVKKVGKKPYNDYINIRQVDFTGRNITRDRVLSE